MRQFGEETEGRGNSGAVDGFGLLSMAGSSVPLMLGLRFPSYSHCQLVYRQTLRSPVQQLFCASVYSSIVTSAAILSRGAE